MKMSCKQCTLNGQTGTLRHAPGLHTRKATLVVRSKTPGAFAQPVNIQVLCVVSTDTDGHAVTAAIFSLS